MERKSNHVGHRGRRLQAKLALGETAGLRVVRDQAPELLRASKIPQARRARCRRISVTTEKHAPLRLRRGNCGYNGGVPFSRS